MEIDNKDFEDLLGYLSVHRQEDSVTELMAWSFDQDPAGALRFFRVISKKYKRLNNLKNVARVVFYSQQTYIPIPERKDQVKIRPDLVGIVYDQQDHPVAHLVIECKIDARLGDKKNYRYLKTIKNNYFFFLCPQSRLDDLPAASRKARLDYPYRFISYLDFANAFKASRHEAIREIVRFIESFEDDDPDDEIRPRDSRAYLRKAGAENALARPELFDTFLRRVLDKGRDFRDHYQSDSQGSDTGILYFSSFVKNKPSREQAKIRFFSLSDADEIGRCFGSRLDGRVLNAGGKIDCPDYYEAESNYLFYLDKKYKVQAKEMRADEKKLYGLAVLLQHFEAHLLATDGSKPRRGWKFDAQQGFSFFIRNGQAWGFVISFHVAGPLFMACVKNSLDGMFSRQAAGLNLEPDTEYGKSLKRQRFRYYRYENLKDIDKNYRKTLTAFEKLPVKEWPGSRKSET